MPAGNISITPPEGLPPGGLDALAESRSDLGSGLSQRNLAIEKEKQENPEAFREKGQGVATPNLESRAIQFPEEAKRLKFQARLETEGPSTEVLFGLDGDQTLQDLSAITAKPKEFQPFTNPDQPTTAELFGISEEDPSYKITSRDERADLAESQMASWGIPNRADFEASFKRAQERSLLETTKRAAGSVSAGAVGIGEMLMEGGLALLDASDRYDLIGPLSEDLFGVNIFAGVREDPTKSTSGLQAVGGGLEGGVKFLNQGYELAFDIKDFVARKGYKHLGGDRTEGDLVGQAYQHYLDRRERHLSITPGEGEAVVSNALALATTSSPEEFVEREEELAKLVNPAIAEAVPIVLDATIPGPAAAKIANRVRQSKVALAYAKKAPGVVSRSTVNSTIPTVSPKTAAGREGAKRAAAAGQTRYNMAKAVDTALTKTYAGLKKSVDAPAVAPGILAGASLLAGGSPGGAILSAVFGPMLKNASLATLEFAGKHARDFGKAHAKAVKYKAEMMASGAKVSSLSKMAADSTAPNWVRRTAATGAQFNEAIKPKAVGLLNLSGDAFREGLEEALQQAAVVGTTPEQIGEAAGGGAAAGGAIRGGYGLAGSLGGGFDYDTYLADQDALAYRVVAEGRGDNVGLYDNLTTQTRRDIAAVQGALGDASTVKLVDSSEVEAATGNARAGASFNPETNEILVDVESQSERGALAALSHEAGHAAYKGLSPDAKSDWQDVMELTYSRQELDAFRNAYKAETGKELTDAVLADEIFAEQFLNYGTTGKSLLNKKKELSSLLPGGRRRVRRVLRKTLDALGIKGGETTRSGDLLEYTPYADSPEVEAFINDSLKELGKPLPKTELPKPKKKKRKPGRPKGSKNKKKSKDSTDARPQTSEGTTPVTDDPIDVPEVDGVTEPVGPAVPDISDQTSEAILKAIDPATPLEVGTLPNGKSVIPVADMGKHIEYIDGDELATEIGNIDQEIHSPEQALEFAKARAQERDQNRAERGMGHYWASWSDVRDHMVKELGYSRKEADAERKKIQAEVLGEEVSSKDLANDPERRKAVIAAFQERSGKTEASQEELDAMSPTERYEYDVDRALERVTKKAEPSQLEGWTQGDALPVNEDSYAKDTVHVDEFGQKYSPVRKDVEAAAIAHVEQNYDSLKEQYLKENTEGQTLTINTDEWRGMLPGYNGWNAGDVHKAASKANKRLFTEALTEQQGKANNRILFLGGGGGSGKGSVGDLTRQGEYAIVFDGVNGDRKNLLERVQRAKDAGFGVDFAFVHNPPAKAAAQSIGRARHLAEAGKPPRVVPAKILIGDNYDAADVARSLINEDLAATGFDGIMIVDNSGALGEGRVVEGPEAQAVLSRDPAQREPLIRALNEQLNTLQSQITNLPGSERSGETRGSDLGDPEEVPGSNIDLGEGPGDRAEQVRPGDLGGDSPGGGLRLGQVGGGLGRRDTPEGVLGDSVAFTPRREFRHAAESLVGFIRENQEGFSTRLDGVVPTSGYMVAPDKGTEFFITSENLTPESLTDYLEQHAEIFERDGAHLGGWFDTETGRYVLDASFRFDNQADAETLAVKGDQDGIFDLNTYNTIRTKDTDGRPTTTDGRDPADILQSPLDVLAFAEETARREQTGLGRTGGETTTPSTTGNLGEGGDAGLGSGQLDAGRTRSLGTGSEGGDAATSRGPDPRSPEFLAGKPVAGRAPALIESNIAAAEELGTRIAGLETGITGTRVALRGVHWSKATNPGSLDPKVGGGAPGAEGRRQQNNPALFPNRTYFGDDGYAASPEGLVTSQAKSRSDFEVDRDKLWEPGDAPEIVAAARALAAEVEGPNSPDVTTYIEAALQQAGYEGMYIPSQNMGVLFNEHDLTPAATSADVSPGVRAEGGVLFSPARNRDYLRAVDSGDTATQQRLVDEVAKERMPNTKVVNEDGTPRRVFHGTTEGGFTVFDTERSSDSVGATTDPNAFLGAHFAADSEVSKRFSEGLYARSERDFDPDPENGPEVFEVYLDITNPLQIGSGRPDPQIVSLLNTQLAETKSKLAKTRKEDFELEKQQKFEESDLKLTEELLAQGVPPLEAIKAGKGKSLTPEISKKLEEVRDREKKLSGEIAGIRARQRAVKEADRPVTEDEIYELAGLDKDKVLRDWSERADSWKNAVAQDPELEDYGEVPYHVEYAYEVGQQIREALVDKGYDGVVYRNSNPDETAGVADRTAYIAFEPDQIKSAEPITRDDQGNVIPLDQRFSDSTDIRFSPQRGNLTPPSNQFKGRDIDLTRFSPERGVNIDDYTDRSIVALPADRMGVGAAKIGPKGAKVDLSVETQGGRGFMNIFDGGGWAFSDEGTAKRFLKRMKEVADEDGTDSAVVGITVLSPLNHLKNQTGQLAYAEALQASVDAGAVTQRQADDHIKAMSDTILRSKAKAIKQPTKDKFAKISNLAQFLTAVRNKELNFADAASLLTQMQKKTLPISLKEATEIGITPEDVARDVADPEIFDSPSGSIVGLLEVPFDQTPEQTDFHHAYPWTVHGNRIGFLKEFPNVADLTTDQRVRNKAGQVTAQPLQTVLPILDVLKN